MKYLVVIKIIDLEYMIDTRHTVGDVTYDEYQEFYMTEKPTLANIAKKVEDLEIELEIDVDDYDSYEVYDYEFEVVSVTAVNKEVK